MFGRDESGHPQRVLLRCDDKAGLEQAILNAVDSSKTE